MSGIMAPGRSKAHVIMGSLPFISHFIPMQTISKSLQKEGYKVTFITGEVFRREVQQTGAVCIVPAGWATFSDEQAQAFVSRQPTLSFVERENANVTELFIKHTTAQFDAIQKVLAMIKEECPLDPAVLLVESNFLGGLPLKLGATGLQPKGLLTVGILPIMSVSIDTAPPGHQILPDNSRKGRKRNESLNKAFVASYAASQADLNKVLQQLGAEATDLYRHNAVIEHSDRFLQLCCRSIEYPRSDVPPSLLFTGDLPRTGKRSQSLPTWWKDVVLSKEKKRIVAVSQGTVIRDYKSLIIPTLKALADYEDILMVVALGKRGAVLLPSVVVPENARVSDWIPFDDLLQLSDVFVTNGGYGSLQTALSHAVPLVIAAPPFADKPDIADRVEWSGTGINLKTGTPSQESLKTAIMEVLNTEKFKRRTQKIQTEIKSYDPLAIITAAIDGVAGP